MKCKGKLYKPGYDPRGVDSKFCQGVQKNTIQKSGSVKLLRTLRTWKGYHNGINCSLQKKNQREFLMNNVTFVVGWVFNTFMFYYTS